MTQVLDFNAANDLTTEIQFDALIDTDTVDDAEAAELEPVASETQPHALEDLYNQHYRRVFSLCLRMTSNVADAEDLAHDVFIQLHRKLSSFRGESAFTTWLHRITVNQVLMHFRKKSYRSESVTEDGEMPDITQPSTERPSAMPIIDRISLLNAVEQLPRGYRTVFIMHDLQGHEHEEIGQILGISAGTSKSQLHKARMRMRQLLSKRVGETVSNSMDEIPLASEA